MRNSNFASCVSIARENQFVLPTEIFVGSENYIKGINALCGQNVEILYVYPIVFATMLFLTIGL